MKTYSNYAFSLFCAFLVIAGCSRIQYPEGMPKPIQGVEITVTQDGTPLDGAAVTFYDADGTNSKWLIRGKTDSKGVAKMMTYGKYPGAPAGKYKVIITKREETPSKLTPPGGDSPKELAAYQDALEKEVRPTYDLVDPKFASINTSSAEVDISNGSLKHTIDVGKAVRNKIN